MKIRVKGYWTFKRFMGPENTLEMHMEAGNLGEALHHIGFRLGEEFKGLLFNQYSEQVKPSNQILLNGQNYLNLTRKMNTPLKDGDEIILMPMVTGG